MVGSQKVAIVGAGITGLTAAHLLLEKGAEVTIYEASAAEGGLAGTFRSDGFAFDFGPHELCTDNPQLIALLREICGDDLLEVEKRTAQHFRGRYVKYPFEIVDVLRNIGPMLAARAIGEVAWRRARNAFRQPAGDSFESWTESRFGPTLYRTYFGPYTQKVWGMDPSLLDPRTASQRITIDSVWDLIKKTLAYHWLGAEDFKRTHSELKKRFFYTKGGIGTLQRRLAERIARAGGRFEFGKRLASVERDAHEVRALRFDDGTSASGFDSVISTIPLPALLRLALGERANALLVENHLPFRGMAFVFLRIAKPKLLDWHWIYYPDLAIPWQRMTEFSHFGAAMSPAGTTGVTLEISCEPNDATWRTPDAELAQRCIRKLIELGHLQASEVLGFDVVRTTHAYPLQVMGFLEKTQRLVDALGEVTNLVTLGRQGLFRYCNMNECMEMAIDVVPELLSGRAAVRYAKQGTWQGVGVTDRYVKPVVV